MARILIVDDDITIVMTLRRLLQKQGYEVSTAADGEQGWQLAQTELPELIICDWEMPQMNGLEMCRRVKASPQLALSSFILLTARGALDDRIMGLDAGADDFLAKPPDIGELNARVRAGLRSVQLKRDLRRQKEILEQELAEAAEYVRSLLPEPLVSGAIQTAWAFIPSAQLGGDSFNYHWLDEDHLAIYLLDVSGHGVGSALLSASVMNVLRSRSVSAADFLEPASLLAALNTSFPMEWHNEKYFTIWYGVFNRHTRELRYGSAGHPPAFLLSLGQTCQSLSTRGLPIGMLPESTYLQATCTVPPQSTLYLYSDGAYEHPLPEGGYWTAPGLGELITSLHQPHAPEPTAICMALQQKVQTTHFDDDLSLLQVRLQ